MLFGNSCVCGGEHSYAARVQLQDQAFIGVNSDTVAGKFSAIIR
jgi:hypothetical protein